MRFKKLLALIIISTFLLTGCKNDKKYNEYMEEGQQAVKQEQYEDALDYFESALTEKDGDTEATSLHTQVEKILQVEAKIKNKLYDEAIELCNEIIKSDSESSVCRDAAQSLKSQCEKLKEEQENLTFKEEIDKKIDEAKKLMDKEEYMNAKVKLGYIIEEVTGKPSYTEELKECNSLLKTCNDKIDELANKEKEEKVNEIFKKRLNGESISREEEMIFKTAFMQFVGKEYHKKNWVMQIHYGCKRDNNAFMYEQLGPDTGYDCINNYAPSAQTADFLNSLIASNELPKTILYSLNPNDNEAIGTILGCFQGTEAAGKIQQGSAWWFNDHKTGMIAQMTSLANLGLLANFVGMLTDSRSFLSYTRHEYFRRILCELIGGWVENGGYPADYKTLKEIVCGISYNNAVDYFGFDL